MIKISANISKKVPIPAKEYSSQAFGASLEIEVSDADKPEAIQSRIRELYGLLSRTIDEQIAGATGNVNGNDSGGVPQTQQPAILANGNRIGQAGTNRTNGAGATGRKTTATEAQQRAIFAICKNLNLDVKQIAADYNVTDVAQLPIKSASQLIDTLKSRQNNASPRQ